MPRLLPSLILATGLGVLPAGVAAQTSSPAPTTHPSSGAATTAPTRSSGGTAQTPSGTATATTGKAKATKPAAGKAAGKSSSGKSATAKKAAVPVKSADCDTPEAKVAATKPVPVAADPLAPTVVPCAEPTRKP
jgi:hypothetical protein